MPVLPAVPSTTTPPGLSNPLASASSMMNLAVRSFTDPPGLAYSALPRMVQPVSSEARRSLINGVLPIEPMASGYDPPRAPSAARGMGRRVVVRGDIGDPETEPWRRAYSVEGGSPTRQ